MNPMEFHRYGTRPSFPSKVEELMAMVDALESQLATRLLHHAFQEIEIKPFTIHPSSFILFTMLANTLSNDPSADKRFDFQFVNPPCGFEWGKDFDAGITEAARGFAGRFGAGLPRKSDGQMLFLQQLAGFVLANGSMFSNQSGEGDIPGYQPRPLASLRDPATAGLPKLLSGELGVATKH